MFRILGRFGQQIRYTWKVLKCGAGEGWRRSVGPIMWEMKKCYFESMSTGISYMIFLCSLTLNNTSSFLTWSVQLIFSILLQHHISKLFPLLARDSPLSIYNKLTHCKLMIRPILTYAGPVWSNTSQSNYRYLQILQSKCLGVIGDYPRRTPIPHLHSTLSLEFIHTFIYRLTDKFFSELYHALQPSYFPNRKLLFTRSSPAVHKIHTNEPNISYCRSYPTIAVFFTYYLFFTAVTFMYLITILMCDIPVVC
jgi:hypothetical protein